MLFAWTRYYITGRTKDLSHLPLFPMPSLLLSQDGDEVDSVRKNPPRSVKGVTYTDDDGGGDDLMDVDFEDQKPSLSDGDEGLEADEEDFVEVVGRKSLSRSAKAKVVQEEPERRTSSRATKFTNSMKEPSAVNFRDLVMTDDKKSREGFELDTELEEDEGNEKPATKPQRRRASQKPAKRQKKAPDSPGHKAPARRHIQPRLTVGHKSTHNEDSDNDQTEESSADSEAMADEEDDEEMAPFKVERIIASRTEPKRAWAEICKTMNSAEIDDGSRWVQSPAEDEDTFEERFLVKWNDLSYLHVSWETEADLIELVEGARVNFRYFFKKGHHGFLYDSDERCDGDYFDPAWTQVERILEVYYPEECPCKSVTNEDTITHDELGIILDKNNPGFENGLGREFMVKWGNCPYSECTFEFERDLILNEIDYKGQLKAYNQRRKMVSRACDACP
jgi:Chromo (CHRromatin Organisation MOdifier) domain